jgi:hypothetical protein
VQFEKEQNHEVKVELIFPTPQKQETFPEHSEFLDMCRIRCDVEKEGGNFERKHIDFGVPKPWILKLSVLNTPESGSGLEE